MTIHYRTRDSLAADTMATLRARARRAVLAQDSAPLTADGCLDIISSMLVELPPEERTALLAGMSEILEMSSNNPDEIAGTNGRRDTNNRDRRPAMDRAPRRDLADFARRHPAAGKVGFAL
jgi:hypothetical protein